MTSFEIQNHFVIDVAPEKVVVDPGVVVGSDDMNIGGCKSF